MDKQGIYRTLTAQGVAYEAVEHKAVYNMAELEEVKLPHPGSEAKNLFVRGDKREHYYLICVKGDKRVDLKAFRKRQGLKSLSFASPEELMDLLGLAPGSVSPLGLLNDTARSADGFCGDPPADPRGGRSLCQSVGTGEVRPRIRLYLDAAFAGGLIGLHPNDNTATVFLQAEELVRVLRSHGSEVCITEL